MFLFFDTETADLPRRWDAPHTDTRNWPRIVQIAWICCGSAEEEPEVELHLIRPDGFRISSGAFSQHGISTEYATEHGEPLRPVLERFVERSGAPPQDLHETRQDAGETQRRLEAFVDGTTPPEPGAPAGDRGN